MVRAMERRPNDEGTRSSSLVPAWIYAEFRDGSVVRRDTVSLPVCCSVCDPVRRCHLLLLHVHVLRLEDIVLQPQQAENRSTVFIPQPCNSDESLQLVKPVRNCCSSTRAGDVLQFVPVVKIWRRMLGEQVRKAISLPYIWSHLS